MKKAIAWILALLLVVLAAGCANASGSRGTEGSGTETRDPDDSSEPTVAVPEELAEYLTQNGDYWFLTLPVSGQRVSIARNDRRLIDKIDLGLLREAEETLLAKIPSNEQGHSFSVAAGSGQWVLYGEVIVPINPPRVGEDGATTGCGIDHDHIYLDAVPISR